MSAMSRVISVGAQHCGNQAVYTFSFMSRRPCGRLHDEHPVGFGALEDVRRIDVFHVERRVLPHEDAVDAASGSTRGSPSVNQPPASARTVSGRMRPSASPSRSDRSLCSR